MRRFLFASVGVLFLPSLALATTTISTVPIAEVGNPGDFTGHGTVNYEYNIGQTEITNAQYTAFLNAVAATDTYGLYHEGMSVGYGGVLRFGSQGSYSYTPMVGRENNPAILLRYWDAARFANWLHNGQPTGMQSAGTTEGGAYTLTPDGMAANSITRNVGWQWAITNDDEWYKAAYYQPAALGGDLDSYWLYPTSSNSITTADANYSNPDGDTMPAGSYPANYYGTYDQGGNAWEWTEGVDPNFSDSRVLRGGSFINGGGEGSLRSTYHYVGLTTSRSFIAGFRVVQIPGPSSLALLGAGGVCALIRRRRTSR